MKGIIYLSLHAHWEDYPKVMPFYEFAFLFLTINIL
jgi:hypothetical protein